MNIQENKELCLVRGVNIINKESKSEIKIIEKALSSYKDIDDIYIFSDETKTIKKQFS